MPTVAISVNDFHQRIGRSYKFEELDIICRQYGMELSLIEKQAKKGEEVKANEQKEYNYEFEVSANRPDLLSIEGLVLAIGVYTDLAKQPIYKVVNKGPAREKMVVTKNTQQIRPYVVCCILRDIKFDQISFDSFIQYQDKLHQTYCRKRRIVAIGTHDYDTIKGPFLYDARPPQAISFASLNCADVLNAEQLFERYETQPEYMYMREYVQIIKKSPVYPIIYDSNNVVLSLPPVINGSHSKLEMHTKNVFVECTATDYERALNTVNCLIASYSQYCKEPFTVEEVEVVYEDEKLTKITPQIERKQLSTTINKINKLGTINIDIKQAASFLEKMQFEVKIADKDKLDITVPIQRTDVMQECDVIEDVCIGYGYKNIEKIQPQCLTEGKPQLLNKMSDFTREEMARANFQEGVNFILCNMAELTTNILKKDDPLVCKILNPRTETFTVGRTTLIPGSLKWLMNNKNNKIPIQLFEVGDVLLKTNENEIGAKNERRLCALRTDTSSGLEFIHGLLDQLMLKFKVCPQHIKEQNLSNLKNVYELVPSNDSTFFPGRQAHILFNKKQIGIIGTIHPDVLDNYKWHNPISLMEINLEPIFNSFE